MPGFYEPIVQSSAVLVRVSKKTGGPKKFQRRNPREHHWFSNRHPALWKDPNVSCFSTNNLCPPHSTRQTHYYMQLTVMTTGDFRLLPPLFYPCEKPERLMNRKGKVGSSNSHCRVLRRLLIHSEPTLSTESLAVLPPHPQNQSVPSDSPLQDGKSYENIFPSEISGLERSISL